MGTPQEHRKRAVDCVVMARSCPQDSDKALWLTLAQSWLRLAEHVARAREDGELQPHDDVAELEAGAGEDLLTA